MMRPLYALVATLGLVLLAAPASASSASPALASSGADTDVCMPSPCEAVNRVCRKVFDVDCVALDSGTTAAAADDCMGPVCDAINRVCYTVLKQWCVG